MTITSRFPESQVIRTFLFVVLMNAFLVQAQTFQAPSNGTYTCFSSPENPFRSDAQQIGSLQITGSSYTFTVGENSETGTVSALKDDSPITDTIPFASAGSVVTLQSQNGTANLGFFFVDQFGKDYLMIISNSNDVYIRCDSPGADIVAAVNGSPADSTQPDTTESDTTQPTTTQPTTTQPTTTPEQPTTPPSPNTINADAPEPGHYTCQGYREYTDDYEDYTAGDIVEIETSELWFLYIAGLDLDTLDIFANGEYSYQDDALFKKEYGVGSLGILEWPETVGRYSFHYNPERYDPEYTSLDWLTGGLRSELYNETDISEFDWGYRRDRPSTFYLGDNGHTEIYLGQEDNAYSLDRAICAWSGPPTRPSPSEVMQATETPENYLQPENITAPTPATNAGGLNGLYISEEGDNLYFMPDGYVYEGVYRWGFDTLAISNVCSRYWTEDANNSKAVCSTYLIQESGIQIGERVPESQQECSLEAEWGIDGYEYVQNCELKEGYNPATDSFLPFSQNADGTLSIDAVLYFPVAPEQNLTLDGTYGYSWSSVSASVATGGTKTITFTQDGQFVYGEDSYLGASFDQGPFTNMVTNINDGQNPNAGTYSISGYTLTLSFNTGLNINYSFFRTDEDAFRLLNYDFTRATPEE